MPSVQQDAAISDLDVVIPDKFLIRSVHKPIKDVVDVIYPDIVQNLNNRIYFRERSILTPTNAIVSDINSYILDLIPGRTHCNSP